MKNKLKSLLLLSLLVLVFCMLITACKKEPPVDPTPPPEEEETAEKTVSDLLVFNKTGDSTYSVSVGSCVHYTELTIPAFYLNGTVTSITDNAFANMPNLKKISLPSTITSIPKGAFSGSSNLESVTVGTKTLTTDSVYSINGKVYGDIGNLAIADGALDGTKFMQLTLADSHDKNAVVDFTALNIQNGITKISVTPKLNEITDMFETSDFDIYADYLDAKINFNTYGLFKNVEVKLYKGETLYAEQTVSDVKVTASQYNFVYLNATYPVLVASLKMNEITANGTIPTFAMLERSASYNWDKLPYNIMPLPMLTEKDATQGFSAEFLNNRKPTETYIKELYELNPYSHFSLYVVDNYPELILEFLVANGIPETNWNAVMLSDGSGTAYYLSDTFGVDNPTEKYEKLKNDWYALKEYFYENGSTTWEENGQYIAENTFENTSGGKYSVLAAYPYVIAKEQDNVEWWVNRLRAGENLAAVNAKDPDFTSDIIASAKSFYTNNLLAALTGDDINAFKDLYNFNDEMFSAAEEQNKKVMVILGTSWSGEAANFYNYIKLTMKYYGDGYVYYYKGHPGYPTSLYPDRASALARLAEEGYVIYELDNAIAAEVILFFYPGIYSSGWETSTFDSLETHTNAGILYDVPLSNSANYTYGDMMEVYANDIAANTTAYGDIALDAAKQYCLLEYNSTTKYSEKVAAYEKHEIAIYNVTDDEIKYYKSVGQDTWKEVTADGADVTP